MYKYLITLTAIAAVGVAAPGFAADKESSRSEVKVEKDSSGNYNRKTEYEHKDANGTKTTEDTETKVKTDKDAARSDKNPAGSETVETTTTKDPRGLMNKTTTKSKTSVKKNHDGSTNYHHKDVVNGKTVDEQDIETKKQ